jgi:hypothetical protein
VSQSQSGPPACAGECHLVRVRSVLADPGSPVMCYSCVTANWLVRAPQADWAAGAGRRAGAPAVVLHGARSGVGNAHEVDNTRLLSPCSGNDPIHLHPHCPPPVPPRNRPGQTAVRTQTGHPCRQAATPAARPEHQSRRRTARLSRPAPVIAITSSRPPERDPPGSPEQYRARPYLRCPASCTVTALLNRTIRTPIISVCGDGHHRSWLRADCLFSIARMGLVELSQSGHGRYLAVACFGPMAVGGVRSGRLLLPRPASADLARVR